MRGLLNCLFISSIICFIVLGCKSKIVQKEDEVYSRHLQEHVKLTIISTPMPDDKGKMNLLLFNDGQELGQIGLKSTLDSLYEQGLICPLLVVGIHAANRLQDYGVSGYPDYRNNGSKADKYAAFVDNELYNFVKKRAGVRKFNSVVIAGCSLGGLSALDIAWDNADKIDKVGVFSGAFWYRDKDVSDNSYSDAKNRIMQQKIRSSRKKPKLKYWFYAGGAEEKGDRDKDGIIDVLDDTRDLVKTIRDKNVCPPGDVVYSESPEGTHDYGAWRKALPGFLTWAFAK